MNGEMSETAGSVGDETQAIDPAGGNICVSVTDTSASGQQDVPSVDGAGRGGRDTSKMRAVVKDKAAVSAPAADKTKDTHTATVQDKERGEVAASSAPTKGQGQLSVEEEYKAKLAEKRRLAREKAEQEAAEAKRIAEEKK